MNKRKQRNSTISAKAVRRGNAKGAKFTKLDSDDESSQLSIKSKIEKNDKVVIQGNKFIKQQGQIQKNQINKSKSTKIIQKAEQSKELKQQQQGKKQQILESSSQSSQESEKIAQNKNKKSEFDNLNLLEDSNSQPFDPQILNKQLKQISNQKNLQLNQNQNAVQNKRQIPMNLNQKRTEFKIPQQIQNQKEIRKLETIEDQVEYEQSLKFYEAWQQIIFNRQSNFLYSYKQNSKKQKIEQNEYPKKKKHDFYDQSDESEQEQINIIQQEQSLIQQYYRHEREAWYIFVIEKVAIVNKINSTFTQNLSVEDQGGKPFVVEFRAQNMFNYEDQQNLEYIASKFESLNPDCQFIQSVYQQLLVTVTDGFDNFYQLVLTENYLDEHKKDTGIEGSWASFFELFKQALDSQSIQLAQSQDSLILKIGYPLISGAKIFGKITLGQNEQVTGVYRKVEMRNMLIRSIIEHQGCDEQTKLRDQQNNICQPNFNTNLNNLGQQNMDIRSKMRGDQSKGMNASQSGMVSKVKDKIKGDLINPNRKKKRPNAQGAQFI